MTTKVRFLLFAILFTVCVLGGVLMLLDRVQRDLFENEAKIRSHLVSQFGRASRAYTKETLRPAVSAHTDAMVFEAMSSTFVTSGIFEEFNKTVPEYRYRQASLNPLNLANKADAYEEAMIGSFADDPQMIESSGYRYTDGKRMFFTARPILVTDGCLKCHGRVEDVRLSQPEILERYGSKHGFDWQPGGVAGVQLISVPTEDLLANYASMRKLLLCLFAGLTVVLIGVSYVFFSIALRRTNELKKARIIAEQASESKTQFLANMSHEIRTPMTAILGFADEIRESGDLSRAPVERIEAIDTIRRNGEHLLNLINDILDLTKIESGKMELERVRFSAVEMLADIQSLMQMQASEKGLAFNIEFVGGIPASIESDPMRVRQVLVNLIGNAIKFTLKGSVRVAVRLIDDGACEPAMRIDVVDSGIGLSEEQVGKLFKAYSQADASMSRRFGGSGLGLNICHRIVEMLDGSIEIESVQGKGSTFSLMIPVGSLAGIEMLDDPGSTLSIRNQRTTMSLPEPGTLNARILLAEDGVDNQKLIAHMLRKTGAQVQIVGNGQLALDAAILAKKEGDAFDVILMDMQMPVMDGYQATNQLRRAGYTGTIIALTAHAMDDERRKCLKVGCDEFVSKPIDRNRLIRLIDEYSKGSRASSAA